jgi:hypothetical protein
MENGKWVCADFEATKRGNARVELEEEVLVAWLNVGGGH